MHARTSRSVLTVFLVFLLVLTAAQECNPPCGDFLECGKKCDDCDFYCTSVSFVPPGAKVYDESKCGGCPNDPRIFTEAQVCIGDCLPFTCKYVCDLPWNFESLSSSNTTSSSGIIASYAGAVFVAMTIMIVQG